MLLNIEKQYKYIELDILQHVFSCIYFEDDQKLRQKFQIKKMRDLLHESVKKNSHISALENPLCMTIKQYLSLKNITFSIKADFHKHIKICLENSLQKYLIRT